MERDFQSLGLANRNDEFEDDLWPPYCNPSYVMPERIEVKVYDLFDCSFNLVR